MENYQNLVIFPWVTAFGNKLIDAYEKAYEVVESIDFKEGFYRTDIGLKGLKRNKLAT